MAEEYDAHVYRLAQVQKLLNLFEAAHRGRPARRNGLGHLKACR
jgi:hypothetical protein